MHKRTRCGSWLVVPTSRSDIDPETTATAVDKRHSRGGSVALIETLGTGCNVEGSGMGYMLLGSLELAYRYGAFYRILRRMRTLFVGLGIINSKHGFGHRFAIWRTDGELIVLLI